TRGVVAASTVMTREVKSASALPGQGCSVVSAAAAWAASRNASKVELRTDICFDMACMWGHRRRAGTICRARAPTQRHGVPIGLQGRVEKGNVGRKPPGGVNGGSADSLQTGKITGNFLDLGAILAFSVARRRQFLLRFQCVVRDSLFCAEQGNFLR